MVRIRNARTFVALGLAAVAASSQALYLSGFDTGDGFTSSTAGTLITGQNGWYLPAVTGAVDLKVFTHVGEDLNFPSHPLGGGTSYAGLNNPGTPSLGRAQRDTTYEAGLNYISYDMCAKFSGTVPATQNLGSFSLQNSVTSRHFIGLFTWTDLNVADKWNMQLNCWDIAGVATNNVSPGAAFSNLDVNKWYRQEFVFDMASNRIVETSVTDLSTGVRTTTASSTWYLTGGAAPTLAIPTAFRLFVGGTVAGNTAGFDNFVQGPPAATNTSADIVTGTPFGGGVSDLTHGDNVYMYVLNDENEPNGKVRVAAQGTGGTDGLDVGVIVELSSTRDDLSLFIRMKNQSIPGYTTIQTGATSFSDKQYQAFIAGGYSAYVNSSFQAEVELEFIPQQDLETSDGWSQAIDRVSIFID